MVAVRVLVTLGRARSQTAAGRARAVCWGRWRTLKAVLGGVGASASLYQPGKNKLCAGLRGSVLPTRSVMRRGGAYLTCGLSPGSKKPCAPVGWLAVTVPRGWAFLSSLSSLMDWRGWYLLRSRFYDPP